MCLPFSSTEWFEESADIFRTATVADPSQYILRPTSLGRINRGRVRRVIIGASVVAFAVILVAIVRKWGRR